MKNNVPEVGDVVVVNEASLDEMKVNKEEWYRHAGVGDFLRGELKVDIVEYHTVSGTKDKKIWAFALNPDGTPAGAGCIVTKPLLLLAHFAAINNSPNVYCSCSSPNLTTNTVLGQSFQYCKNCKKERE